MALELIANVGDALSKSKMPLYNQTKRQASRLQHISIRFITSDTKPTSSSSNQINITSSLQTTEPGSLRPQSSRSRPISPRSLLLLLLRPNIPRRKLHTAIRTLRFSARAPAAVAHGRGHSSETAGASEAYFGRLLGARRAVR
ncbi:hypothetical protein C2857_004850 [Epichloe festucae Fl1]|uniref:Uncharacterized protein n=1 Tax=Epichloe festucae (strain Fl1) TaxID=877507 RepID=A0A7S9KPA1_EPIFF|nr:hypothetical protein C2857_004850 [Epichloe festucae Fl1]